MNTADRMQSKMERGVIPLMLLPRLKSYLEYEHPTGRILARHKEPLDECDENHGFGFRVGLKLVAIYQWHGKKFIRIGSSLIDVDEETRIDLKEGHLFNCLIIYRRDKELVRWRYCRSSLLLFSRFAACLDTTGLEWDSDECLDVGLYLLRHAHERRRGFSIVTRVPPETTLCPLCSVKLPTGDKARCPLCGLVFHRTSVASPPQSELNDNRAPE